LAPATRATHNKFQVQTTKNPRAPKKKHTLPLGAKRLKSAVCNMRNSTLVRVIIAWLNQQCRGAKRKPQAKFRANLKFDDILIKVSRI